MLSTANFASEGEFDPSVEMIAAISTSESEPTRKRAAYDGGSSASGGIYRGGLIESGQSQNATQSTSGHITIE